MNISINNQNYPVLKREVTRQPGEVIADYYVGGMRYPVTVSRFYFNGKPMPTTSVKVDYKHIIRHRNWKIKFV